MTHLLILPLLVPLVAGALLVILAGAPLPLRRALGLSAMAIQLGVCLQLFAIAQGGGIEVYLTGDWPAPYGIVFVLDRLSALMLMMAAILAAGALAYSILGTDRAGPGFHALFQFQLLGLNGAFLTGDLFNLFVFFEIMLISSYGLLLHGGGQARTRAGLHYVVLNLIGSSLFLIAIALLYGVTGTLNMADLGRTMATLAPGDVALAKTGALLLLTVFALKAAVLPLHFWLPHAYGTASAPVAALFAIMTKVGIYGIVRLFTLFGHDDGPLAGVAAPWLVGASLLTLAAGTFGAMASLDLRRKVAYLVMVSVGTLLMAVSLGTAAGLTGAFFYLLHTTLVTAALFLLADLIAFGRVSGSLILAAERPQGSALLAILFMMAAVAVVGMPPLSGMVGKILILQAANGSAWGLWIWTGILVSGMLILVSLSRTGSELFWRGGVSATEAAPDWRQIAPAALLLAASPLLVVFGGPVSEYAKATAGQITDTARYIDAVLATAPVSPEVPGETP